MGSFLTSPGCDVRHHTDGSGLATLLRTIRYRDDSGRVWLAPGRDEFGRRAMCGDGASKPRFLWPIFGHPFAGDHQRPGWLHDKAYQDAEPCTVWEAMFGDARARADAMFYQAVRDDIAENGSTCLAPVRARWRLISRALRALLLWLAAGDDAYALFLGVRLGGWLPWWKYGRAKAVHRRSR